VQKILQKANVWSKLVNHVNANEDYKNFEKNEDIKKIVIACRNYMLEKSGSHEMNEPAFYKNKSLTDELVKTTVSKYKKEAEKIY
jgi:putative NADPH-quinone reductase